MNFSKILKYALTVTAAALLFHGATAHSGEKSSEAPKTEASKDAAHTERMLKLDEARKAAADKKAPAKAERTIKLEVTEDGYVPSPIKLRKDEPVALQVTRKTDKTCATELVMKEYNINQDLPLNREVTVRFTPNKSGTLKYGCAMSQMISGQFVIE